MRNSEHYVDAYIVTIATNVFTPDTDDTLNKQIRFHHLQNSADDQSSKITEKYN